MKPFEREWIERADALSCLFVLFLISLSLIWTPIWRHFTQCTECTTNLKTHPKQSKYVNVWNRKILTCKGKLNVLTWTKTLWMFWTAARKRERPYRATQQRRATERGRSSPALQLISKHPHRHTQTHTDTHTSSHTHTEKGVSALELISKHPHRDASSVGSIA